MPAFPQPTFTYNYEIEEEISNLKLHKKERQIPEKNEENLLIATWNLANFGIQKRRDTDLKIMAEIIDWFDVIALQEVRQNLSDLQKLISFLNGKYSTVFTDVSGNSERMVFLYDTKKVNRRELVGEVAPYPKDLPNIKFESAKTKFDGFDRNPFIQSFRWKEFEFCLANVHLYYGSQKESKKSMERRQLETYAVARWANMQKEEKYNAEPNVILLGDFNLPHMEKEDPVYKVLTKFGMILTEHSTLIGATLPSESRSSAKEVYQYDQIAFFPSISQRYTNETGTFDFDAAIFKKLWNEVEQKKKKQSQFNGYVKYYISDHRPLWARFK
jgi:endonuclease/exonuclease/phosphatase family metal-dependent hydrolase